MQQAKSSYNPLDGIDWGTKVAGDNTIEVYFAPKGTVVDGYYTSEGMNAYEIEQFTRAFKTFESIANLHFVRVYSKAAADFVLGLDADREMGKDDLGYMNPPGTSHEGHAMFNGRAWDRTPGGDLEKGGYSYVTIVHELLHGLGFAHPHDKGGSSSRFPGVTSAFGDYGPAWLNQGVFTIMTYNSGFQKGPVGTSAEKRGFEHFGYEAGPMALDIALLQEKYGANMSYHSGNNTYHLPDANRIGTFYVSIWDTGGNDKIDYAGSRDSTIDLRPATLGYERGGGGYISGAKGIAGGFTIAAGVVIENAKSAGGNDTLIGNGANNRLVAGAGSDKVRGAAGDDEIRGGRGADHLFGGNGDDHVLAGAGADKMKGGSGNDHLVGNAGADTIFGGGGNDRIQGGGGNDTLNGGDGADTFVFSHGTGHDRVEDFSTAEDKLHFDISLFGGRALTARQIAHLAEDTHDGILWSFDDGSSVLLVGQHDLTGLADAILV